MAYRRRSSKGRSARRSGRRSARRSVRRSGKRSTNRESRKMHSGVTIVGPDGKKTSGGKLMLRCLKTGVFLRYRAPGDVDGYVVFL